MNADFQDLKKSPCSMWSKGLSLTSIEATHKEEATYKFEISENGFFDHSHFFLDMIFYFSIIYQDLGKNKNFLKTLAFISRFLFGKLSKFL
jgi:hypothetical protein